MHICGEQTGAETVISLRVNTRPAQLVNKAASGDLRALQQLAALARSAEERSSEVALPNSAIEEVDQKVLQGILARFEGGSNGCPEPNNE
jgi:hypothetical protein